MSPSLSASLLLLEARTRSPLTCRGRFNDRCLCRGHLFLQHLLLLFISRAASMMAASISLIFLLLPSALGAAFPSPEPTAAAQLVKRDTCNADNCLRAVRGRSSDGSAFCSSYTAPAVEFGQSYAGPTPTWVPTTCTAARLSSACYCNDVPSWTAPPTPSCPAPGAGAPAPSQVIQRPSFYYYQDTSYLDIAPWVITYDSGLPGCVPSGTYSNADMEGPWGDYKYMWVLRPTFATWERDADGCSWCSFGTGPGKTGLSAVIQDVVVCPNQKYTFTYALSFPHFLTISLTEGAMAPRQRPHGLRAQRRQRQLRQRLPQVPRARQQQAGRAVDGPVLLLPLRPEPPGRLYVLHAGAELVPEIHRDERGLDRAVEWQGAGPHRGAADGRVESDGEADAAGSGLSAHVRVYGSMTAT